ncbi:hypothetical protein [Denitrobacterium detoxificans]|jgi:hypothetical protein|uniref:hypothetical protein n=1 Tax=Denitrobacterium detoxificans TaxID=79604 RepID=UPI0026F15E74|nr:hypothetical protein [Denitrobacterium detoxificans]MBE6466491.1 hypothetical protein [Denitrobacterium detoxificans]
MIIAKEPEKTFSFKRNLFAEDALSFVSELEQLDPQAVVGRMSGKLQAEPGVWVRVADYRRANGSFIDHSDLMLYVEQYYEPDAQGPIEALELNYRAEVPEGAISASTVDDLLEALVVIDSEDDDEPGLPGEACCLGDDAAKGLDEVVARGESAAFEAEGSSGNQFPVSDEEVDVDEERSLPSRLEGMKAIAPSGDPDMRGLLVDGWHAMYYKASDGSSLLVFD